LSGRRTALVHDYLNQRGGAERVFGLLARAYPDAPIFTSIHDRAGTADLVPPERVRASWLSSLPYASRAFRYFAPLYPGVFESFDFTGYDLIISSTTSFAKGVIVPAGAVHVCLIHTVSRFVYDYEGYVGGFRAGPAFAPFIKRLAAWDRRAAARPTALIANSNNVARRVRAHYGRDSYVLPPPIDLDRFSVGPGGGGYYLVVSRLLPYKRIDVAIDACAQIDARLIVAGSGPALESLKARARGTKTEFAGYVPDDQIVDLMRRAEAVLLPGEEDFGLVPVEANACGRPAIAFGGGGALETILPGITGEHFPHQNAASLSALLRGFSSGRYDPADMRRHAETFSPARFIARFREIVEEVVALRGS
jgi:glycosyltransferase involved in cell wall biosynthesis